MRSTIIKQDGFTATDGASVLVRLLKVDPTTWRVTVDVARLDGTAQRTVTKSWGREDLALDSYADERLLASLKHVGLTKGGANV